MRHTIRPFVKEFKIRASKSVAAHPQGIEAAGKDEAKPPFLDLAIATAPSNDHDDAYQAALKAADAIFGRSPSSAAPDAEVPASSVPTGRVLPSLIEETDALTQRLMEANKEPRRGRKSKKAESSSAVPRKLPTPPQKKEVAKVAARSPVKSTIEIEIIAAAPRRERRSIQKRWVLRTELKAGEKWKRRLPKSAR